MVQYQIEVEGMTCHRCEDVVRERVTALPGVSLADPDHEVGSVFVKGGFDQESEIRRAIDEAGYRPVE
jgi:copper chaperone CopZ